MVRPQLLRHIEARLAAVVADGASICVGLSGGLDSVVLLDLLAGRAPKFGLVLSAVHVHHGLSPNADAWATFCDELCAARRVPLSIARVGVDRAAPEGLEAAARAARYAVYASRSEAFVALAHHLDDQSETILLQLLRGTGLKGVAAMPEVRALPGSNARIFRPLLGIPRALLAAHARETGLAWIEDESNAALHHDRNFLRHEIASGLDTRFAGWREALSRFSRHAAAADALLAELARIDGLPAGAGEALRVDAALSPERRANLLRAYLALNAVAMPSEARLAEMTQQLFGARGDARVRIDHAGISLMRHRDRVRIEQLGPQPGAWHHAWHGEMEVELGAARGSIRFERAVGEGLSADLASAPGWHFAGRTGGERMRLDAKRPTRTLKNLLQEHDIPAWNRDRLPLLFHGDNLVWVPGIGVAAGYACPKAAAGLRPTWKMPENPAAKKRPVIK